MIRFLSEEWIDAFNTALHGAELAGETGSIRAASGTYTVEQRVRGVPDRDESLGPVRMLLSVEAGNVSVTQGTGDDKRPDVVVSLAYADAVALSKGELDPTQALSSGRVHVRGDLSVLVAGQALLAAAAGVTAELQANTAY
jgi:SCP-2 sterol transfer family